MADDRRLVDLHWLARHCSGTYETFGAVSRQHLMATLKVGTYCGLAGGTNRKRQGLLYACSWCDETRIDFRLRTRYVDHKATTSRGYATD